MTKKQFVDPLLIIPPYMGGIPIRLISQMTNYGYWVIEDRLKKWGVFGLYEPIFKYKGKEKEYNKKWYENRKEQQIKEVKEHRIEILKWYKEYKKQFKCNRCPENHPACIDFHHPDPNKKHLSVSAMITNGYSKEKIIEEINKCEPLCCNCHRKEHFKS